MRTLEGAAHHEAGHAFHWFEKGLGARVRVWSHDGQTWNGLTLRGPGKIGGVVGVEQALAGPVATALYEGAVLDEPTGPAGGRIDFQTAARQVFLNLRDVELSPLTAYLAVVDARARGRGVAERDLGELRHAARATVQQVLASAALMDAARRCLRNVLDGVAELIEGRWTRVEAIARALVDSSSHQLTAEQIHAAAMSVEHGAGPKVWTSELAEALFSVAAGHLDGFLREGQWLQLPEFP